jgi:SecD/SecF fusion protein
MMQNFGRGFVFIALLIAACVWALQDYQNDIKKGIDLEGGTELLYEIPLDQIDPSQRSTVAADIKDVISRRFDNYGLKEISVAISGRNRLLIQLPGSDNDELERLKGQIERAGELNFQLVAPDSEQTEANISRIEGEMVQFEQALIAFNSLDEAQRASQTAPESPRQIVVERPGGTDELTAGKVVVDNRAPNMVSASYLSNTNPTTNETGQPAVGFEFGGAGATLFADMTGENINRSMAIVLDGKAMSIATINARISRNGILEGNFTADEVNDLVSILRAGSLPAKPVLVNQQTVGALLGKESVDRGTQAMIFGLLLVAIFMLLYYRAAGIIADLSLVMNLMLVVTLLIIFRNTLTFPGMAGLLLTVGMAVDANILIFERIREERDRGKALPAAFSVGFQKAFWTIFDANLTTLITAFVLFQFGTGAVKGFAVVLSIGILTSFFSTVYFSRMILSFLISRGIVTDLSMGRIIQKPNVNFMELREATRILFWVFVVGGIGVLGWRGSDALGIDFTGGTRLSVNLSQPTPESEIRGIIESQTDEYADLQLQAVGEISDAGASRYSLRTSTLIEGEKQTELFKSQMESLIGGANILAPNAVTAVQITENVQDGVNTYLFNANIHVIKGTGASEDVGVTSSSVKDRLLATEFPVETIREISGGPGEAAGIASFELVSAPQLDQAAALALQSQLSQALKAVEGLDFSEPFPEVSSISGRVAKDMQGNTLIALMISFLAIVFYISIRFEFSYGAAAITALVHDICFTLGALALADFLFGDALSLKINLPVVAALLTVVGYSLNDTIVIFDRIRENLRDARRDADYVQLVNQSINQTLSRTVLTSLTTFVVVLILLIFGGEGLQSFAFALCIGVLIGTYSSIFVASPTLIRLQEAARRRIEKARVETALAKKA